MVGYIIFLSSRDSTIRYAALFVVASTVFTPGALTYASLISTWSFLTWDAPDYHIGNGLNFATSSAWLILGDVLLFWMRRDNDQRRRKDIDSELAGLSQQEIDDLDWKHPAFRWKS
ncbi:putative Major facilitator superfamily (MFS) profile domain-containing protein [Seiridium cardinale]|uniref:Major facilitator superfamily (MFS) profile domain-containing protein n=1 Tax=Seiridium cardinale TaxID=138064 RepID=A0ABR2XU26_9PEZI